MLKNIDLEKMILSMMLKKSSILQKSMMFLNKEHFTDSSLKRLFILTKKHYRQYNSKLTKSSLINILKEKNKTKDTILKYKLLFKSLINFNVKKESSDYVLSKLDKMLRGRRLLNSIDQGIDLIKKGRISKAEDLIMQSVVETKTKKMTGIIREGSYLDGFEKRKKIIEEKIKNPDKMGFKTGIHEFDIKFGGLMPEELGIILAGTSVGKTAMLVNLAAYSYLKGDNVVFLTIEMPKHQLEYRIDARLCRMIYNKFRLANFRQKDFEKWGQKIENFKKDRKNTLWIIDVPSGCSSEYLHFKLKMMSKMFGNRFLMIIDYLNIMSTMHKYKMDTDWGPQAQIAKEIKQLAREWHVGIWTAAQPSKKAIQKGSYNPEDVGLASQISHHADFMLGIIKSKQNELDNTLQLQCVKGRDGRMEPVLLFPNLDLMLINDKVREISEEDDD